MGANPGQGPGSAGTIAVLADDGKVLWRRQVAGLPTGVAAAASGAIAFTVVHAGVPSLAWQSPRRSDDTVVAGHCGLIAASGTLLWEVPTRAPMLAGPLVARSGGLILAGADGWILRTSDRGTIMAEKHLGGMSWDGAEMPDGRLLIASGSIDSRQGLV